MEKILIWNRNELERKITLDILRSGLDNSVEIQTAATADACIQMLRDKTVDLLLADIDRFDMVNCNLIMKAQSLAPDTPILITSAGNQEEIASSVWRLGAHDYLLKPYRPDWLVAAVNALIRHQETAPQSSTHWQQEHLSRLSDNLHRFQYKKCTNTAREYLDLLYESVDNRGELRRDITFFAEGIAKAGASFGPGVAGKLTECLEHFRSRFDWQDRKYDTFVFFVKMLDLIFDTLEQAQVYEIDGEQKILNFIDRNIKRGLSLDEVAEYANMSSCYFSKLFKRMTGKNYIAYVTDSRLEMAKQMLADTEMPVINIAYELSYSETHYFSKAFKKKLGLTPSEYRRTHSGFVKQGAV